MAAFSHEWTADRRLVQHTSGRGAYVPLAFQPGEAFKFDWAEDWGIIGAGQAQQGAAELKKPSCGAAAGLAYCAHSLEARSEAWPSLPLLYPRCGSYDHSD